MSPQTHRLGLVQQSIHRLQKHVREKWVWLLEAKDDSRPLPQRYRARIVGGLILLFSPLTFLFVLYQALTTPYDNPLGGVQAVFVAVVTLFPLLVLYLMQRAGWQGVVEWLGLTLMCVCVVVFAMISDAPYFTILYMVFVPLIASPMLRASATLLTSLIAFAILIGFLVWRAELIPGALELDYGWFFFAILVNQLYLAYQRNWLERQKIGELDRRQSDLLLLFSQLPAHVWTLDLELRPSTTAADGRPGTQEATAMVSSLCQNEQTRGYLQRALAGERSTFEHSWAQKPYRAYVQPLRGHQREIVGCVGLSVDVQSEQRAAIQAAEQERARVMAGLLRDAAHDLRTPLSVINTTLHLMERATDPQKQAERRDRLKSTLKQLEEMINSIFLMLRIDLLPQYVASEVDVNALLEQVVIDLIPLSLRERVLITSILSPELPHLHGHSAEMQIALMHVVRNALQYTPAHRTVQVKTFVAGDCVVVEVSDQGIGIDPQKLPFIFDRFYRGDEHRPMEDSRVGMGLAIAKGVIEKHGGTIDVVSEVGQGSTFTMRLPISSGEASA